MPKTSEAYRTYLIKKMSGPGWAISKGGFHIGTAVSVSEAKKIIDAVIG